MSIASTQASSWVSFVNDAKERDMPTVMMVLNVLCAVGVVAVIAGGFRVAIATQHRDHRVLAYGPFLRRRIWSRTGRPHAGPVRPRVARQGEVWPAA
jgi:hypothetical protein